MSRFAAEFAGCVWTEAVPGKKCCGFKNIPSRVDRPKQTTITATRTSLNKRFTEQNKAVHVRF